MVVTFYWYHIPEFKSIQVVIFGGTQLLQPDAPSGLVQPLPCSETSSEQTHGFRFWSTNPGALQLLIGIRVGFG